MSEMQNLSAERYDQGRGFASTDHVYNQGVRGTYDMLPTTWHDEDGRPERVMVLACIAASGRETNAGVSGTFVSGS